MAERLEKCLAVSSLNLFSHSPLFPFLLRLQSGCLILSTGLLLQLCSFSPVFLFMLHFGQFLLLSSLLIFSPVESNPLFTPFNFFSSSRNSILAFFIFLILSSLCQAFLYILQFLCKMYKTCFKVLVCEFHHLCHVSVCFY